MIRILTTLYNSRDFLPLTIASLKEQDVQEWKCYITDDISTDGSYELALELTRDDPRFVVIRNTLKFFQVGNYYQVMMRPEIEDDDIIITVDGDDWLPDPRVFRRVLRLYEDPDVWISWGRFSIAHGETVLGVGSMPQNLDNLRTVPFKASHLRTWKAFLWREIREADLLHPSGTFWNSAGDMAFMIPMLEMAGYKHSRYTPEINYIYNWANPISEFRVMEERANENVRLIEEMPRYPLLMRKNDHSDKGVHSTATTKATMDERVLRDWRLCAGDRNLRLGYPLHPASVVIDAGGYEGQWAADIFSLYQCRIAIFEPVRSFAEAIVRRFAGNTKIEVHDRALSSENGTAEIHVSADSSSTIASAGTPEKIVTVDASKYFDAMGLDHIDLLKINIEGGEFDLLPNLIDSKWIEQVTDIQVQFHEFVPNAVAKVEKIREGLSRTHRITWMFPMVWENWTRKT